ncbi:hypothetical protein Hanom_Chr13g01227601 [Helianthus anomalus]
MRKNKPLDESRKTGQTSTKMAFYSYISEAYLHLKATLKCKKKQERFPVLVAAFSPPFYHEHAGKSRMLHQRK